MFTEDILSTESGKDNLKTPISPKASPPVHGSKCKLCGKMIGRLSTLGNHVMNQHYTAIRGMVSRNSKTMQKIAAIFKEKKVTVLRLSEQTGVPAEYLRAKVMCSDDYKKIGFRLWAVKTDAEKLKDINQ
ncbi:uncharacterized protein LOC117194401 [Drosophila miranda]|uniref:uncharacterized protein LOC117194401 n=1 Tax=Drosophila miranda TaxID=7229 RepID=UPI00143F1E06|nr:uncharacterized protein LOC117194401 [Drosophila miranda]